MPNWLARIVSAVAGIVPGGSQWLSRIAINSITNSTRPRPHPLSLWSPDSIDAENGVEAGSSVQSARFTAWPGLIDREFSGRHLPPANPGYVASLPDIESQVLPLFERQAFLPCPRSSALLCFFAQWFTDSFLRTHPVDKRKNTSNHEIDLCQIYGLNESVAAILRSGSGGEMRHELIDGAEYGEKIFSNDHKEKPYFRDLPYLQQLDAPLRRGGFDQARKYDFYATGLERGNSTILYSALNTVFRREHNRLCREMKTRFPDWDDDRLFHTARNVNTTLLLKLIVEEYVNHLSGQPIKFFVDVGFAEKQKWYRTNRIAIEFDLLYRWHALVPEPLHIEGDNYDHSAYMYNNPLLERYGVERVIKAASMQPAGRIGLGNTPKFLVPAEAGGLALSRQFQVRPYNEYRVAFAQAPIASFQELTGEKVLADQLEALYGNVDRVELGVGLLAEQRDKDKIFGKLMTTMVGADAFSQALTNPLLSGNVFGEDTFSEYGLETIAATRSFQDIVKRNCSDGFNPSDVYASLAVQ